MLVASNIYGPFVMLPEELQRLALQLVYYFDALPAKLLKALTACCTAPHAVILIAVSCYSLFASPARNLNMSVLRYMTEILYHSYVKVPPTSQAWLSFLYAQQYSLLFVAMTQGALSQFELASTVLSLLVANSANRKYQDTDEEEDDDGEEVEELTPQQARKKTRTSGEATTSTSTQKQTRSRAVKDTQKGKEKENEMEVVVVDADDDEGESVVEDRAAAAGGEKAAAKAERARTERREVAEIIVANVRLWGVTEALGSMQSMLTLLLVPSLPSAQPLRAHT